MLVKSVLILGDYEYKYKKISQVRFSLDNENHSTPLSDKPQASRSLNMTKVVSGPVRQFVAIILIMGFNAKYIQIFAAKKLLLR